MTSQPLLAMIGLITAALLLLLCVIIAVRRRNRDLARQEVVDTEITRMTDLKLIARQAEFLSNLSEQSRNLTKSYSGSKEAINIRYKGSNVDCHDEESSFSEGSQGQE
jgi:hypothetical protein